MKSLMKTIKYLVIIFAVFSWVSCNKNLTEKYSIKILKTESGYYYDVYKKGKLFIHQPNIPAAIGNQEFKDSLQCLRIAELVVQKMEKKNFPTITIEELKKNNIEFKN